MSAVPCESHGVARYFAQVASQLLKQIGPTAAQNASHMGLPEPLALLPDVPVVLLDPASEPDEGLAAVEAPPPDPLEVVVTTLFSHPWNSSTERRRPNWCAF